MDNQDHEIDELEELEELEERIRTALKAGQNEANNSREAEGGILW